jgi:transcriptional regulator with XRE-family HTH domain
MSEPQDESIGDRIAARMAAHKPKPLEAIDVAAATRASTYTVKRWLDDVTKPNAENLPPLAQVLGVPIFWLLTGHFETMSDWLDEGEELKVPGTLSVEQIQAAAEKFTLDQWIEARRLEGMSDEEIGGRLYERGRRLAPATVEPTETPEPTAEPSAQPVAEVPSDEEIAEQLERRPDAPARKRGESRQDRRGTKRRRSSGEEEQP